MLREPTLTVTDSSTSCTNGSIMGAFNVQGTVTVTGHVDELLSKAENPKAHQVKWQPASITEH